MIHRPSAYRYINKGRAGYSNVTSTYFADASVNGQLAAVWIGHAGALMISQVTHFRVSDLYLTTAVTLQNTGSGTMSDVYYMRSIDPSQETVSQWQEFPVLTVLS